MAYSNQLRCITLEAAASLTDAQYKIVDLGTVGKCDVAAAGLGHGVLQNHPGSGEAATVAVEGETRCRAGGTIALNAYVQAAASGWAVAVGSAGTSGRVLGRAKSSAASGSVFTLEIMRFAVSSAGAI